jgi:hypothetical protein
VDWNKLKGALGGASIAEPTLAIRAAREVVKVERADGLVHLVRDVGRVQAKAGTRAALEGLKVAESSREMSRVAKLADAKGGKTRAILKLVGRGAIVLTLAALDLGLWILGALFVPLGFVSSLKGATERVALRIIRRGKESRLKAEQRRFAAMFSITARSRSHFSTRARASRSCWCTASLPPRKSTGSIPAGWRCSRTTAAA